MIYRRTRPSDRIDVKSIIEKSNLFYDGREPLIGFVAIGREDKLEGVSYAHQAAIIDPFICTEPMAAMKLFCMTAGALSALNLDTVIVQVSESNKRLTEELKRLGFKKVEERYAIFKKTL